MDFVGNNNPTPLYEALRRTGRELPDYCKRDVFTFEETEKLANVAFADSVNRELPVHEKAATWLSAIYFYSGEAGTNSKDVENKINNAADVFGITEDIEEIKAAFTSQEKKASNTKSAYALKFEDSEYYPIGNIGEIFGSSEAIISDIRENDLLGIKEARTASINLVKAAVQNGVPKDELPARILQLSMSGEPNFSHALACANLRKQASNDDRVPIYKEIVEYAEEAYKKEGSKAIEEAIDAWLLLDEELGIKYSHLQPDPYVAMYSGCSEEDIDKAANNVVMIEDVLVPKIVFSSISDNVIDREFAGDTNIVIKRARDKTDPREAEAIIKEALSDSVRKELLKVLLSETV
jgi:hypothetical protein